ncbi:glucose/galactose transporter [Arcticibacter tournemirensis]|uniref:Sugar MFS transporter n=1 Tax=Arcticibacter tournemirensis TaxID=699437 RepID=A0A5M9H930_9SPHI|nr:sugar MFS transporter [Arcticibacter tournemirensis]KAA8482859.1 sugar MFS transporter [Arcticibacter tournemirensis]TQM49763.1 glucose/galactose transporter [Arcticibacter tournemirensis]
MSKNIKISEIGNLNKRDNLISIIIIGILFFIFGFVTWINAILIPYFKIACELSNFQSYLVAFAFYISYLLMSVPASFLLKKAGFKSGMMIGFWVMAAGAFIFVPAALTRTYELFLTGLFTLGIGLAILQTAANPYVTILGPKESAARRFSIMGICNKFAGIIAPLLFAAVILRQADSELFQQLKNMSGQAKDTVLDQLIQRVIVPYATVGCVLFALGLFVRLSPLPEIDTDTESPDLVKSNSGKTSVFDFPHLILGAFAIFLHVGSQVIAVDTVIGYAHSMDINLMEAKIFPSYTLTATIIGYILGLSLIPRYLSQITALRFCTILGGVFTLLIIYSHGQVSILGHTADISIWFVILLGFANSMIWAGIWPLALDNLGRFIKIGSSLLIMGLSGNAILPLVYGYFADTTSLREAYWVLLPCYIYLTFYSFKGYKIKSWSFKNSRQTRTISNELYQN